jgi:Uma2 family endonuclease
MRVPDIGITCVPDEAGQSSLPDPVVLIEVLSPSNAAETWENVWAYTTIPSLREILVLHSVRMAAELLRRQPDGAWPEEPEVIDAEGILALDSVGFSCPLRDVYARTHLGRATTGPSSR